MGALPYYGLAKGFLTGKYRAGEQIDSPRAEGASEYVGEKGDRVLAALAEVARAHGVPVPAVALRWLADQPTVVAPIASGAVGGAAGRPAADAGPRAHRRRSGSS